MIMVLVSSLSSSSSKTSTSSGGAGGGGGGGGGGGVFGLISTTSSSSKAVSDDSIPAPAISIFLYSTIQSIRATTSTRPVNINTDLDFVSSLLMFGFFLGSI